MIQSANDAAEAIAEKIGGSAEAFADLMNDNARSSSASRRRRSTIRTACRTAQDPKRINVMPARTISRSWAWS